MQRSGFAASVLGAALVAMGAAAPAFAQMPEIPKTTSGSADYKVGPHDVVEVIVVNEPEHNRTLQVAQDGTVSLVHVKTVPVEGLTAKQIQEKLEILYREYYNHPQIFVTVKEFKSQSIQVFGAVRNPGQHRLTGSTKILDVLSQIGGPSETGGERLVLLRKLPQKPGSEAEAEFETIDVDMRRLYAEGAMEENHEVKNGDVLFVPRADEVYVLGEVKSPGAVKFEAGMTVTQAISKVAGFTRIASRRIQVVRVQEDGKSLVKKQYDLNVGKIESGKEKDFVLQARDLVVVPESFF